MWLGTSGLELGAISMFWYCFREREQILDLFELVTGARMHTRYFQAGGLAEDIPRGFYPECRKFVERMPDAVDEYEQLVDRNKIWLERTQGVGLLSADDAIALAQSGPVLRASGVDWDLRREQPYLAYDEVDFRVPVYTHGDVYDRYRVHMEEMRESTRIVAQCLDRLQEMEGEPWIADDRKVVLPPREELHTSMESLIHHFKIVTEGYRVPERRDLHDDRVAARRARLLRRLRRRPEAVAREVPRAVVRRAAGDGDLPARVADRRHDRDRRLARHGHGRGRPVSTPLYDEIQVMRRAYPDARSAIMPALRAGAGAARRLASSRGARRGRRGARPDARVLQGDRELLRHVPPRARRPARVEVCTNLACALVGAQAVVEAFERELGVAPGETTEDGAVTFRTIECAGGCGYAPVVVVDSRYREPVTPEDVPALVEELRAET